MPEWLQKITKNPFLTNSFLFTIIFGLTNLINFLANFIIVKGLPIEWYGEYSSAVAYVNLLAVPLTIISLIIIKKIGLEKETARQKFITLTEKRLGATLKKYWWLVILALGLLTIGLTNWANFKNSVSVVFIVLSWPISIVTAIYAGFLQGAKKFKHLGMANIIGALIKVGGALLVIKIAPSLMGVLGAVLLGNVAVLTYEKMTALPKTKKAEGRKKAAMKNLVKSYDLGRLIWQREIWLPTVTTIGVMALVNSDLILVKALMPEMAAGLFGVISLLARTIYYALTPFTQVFFAFGSSKENFKHQNKNLMMSTGFFILVGLVATAIFALLPKLVLVLFATTDYLVLEPILWWAGVIGTFFALANLYAQYFIARNEKKAVVAIGAAILQVGLIVFWHQDIRQILMIDLIVTGLLAVTYLLFFWGKWRKKNAA